MNGFIVNLITKRRIIVAKKRMICISILLCIALLKLSATHTFAAGIEETLIIGMQDDTASFDPAKTLETTAMGILGQAYESLVGLNEEDFSQPVPKLAESWKLEEDGKTWIFHLRRGVLFASGNSVNADAVVFSLRRSVKLAGSPSWILTQFGITEESITKIDEYAVQIVLDRQYAPGLFLSCLMAPVASILDPKVVMEHEQDGDMGSAWLEEHTAGSGPFVLEKRNREIPTQYVLTANEKYWEEKPMFQQIIVKGIQDSIEQMAMLEQGEIDIAWNLQPDQIQVLSNNPKIQIFETLTLYSVCIGMNQGYAPLQKLEVRDAIRYAIDYEGVINYILQGAAVPIQTIIPKGLLGYNPTMPYTYNPEKAKQLLRQGGYPNGFDVELYCLNYSPWLDIGLKIKSDLVQIGINVQIIPSTAEKMVEVLFNRESQLWLWEYGVDYVDPDARAKPFAHSNSLGDDATVKQMAWWFNYVNQETSKLVEQAAREIEPEKRADLYKQVTEIILYDGPFAILFSKIHQYGVHSEISRFIGNPSKVVIPFPKLK
jgi:peptide/nickel transport system substrate-binding protein